MWRGGHLEDRRRSERFPISLAVETERGTFVTRDVSASGLYFTSGERFACGERLHVALVLPDRQCAPSIRFELDGAVVRVDELHGKSGVAIALAEGCFVSPRVSS